MSPLSGDTQVAAQVHGSVGSSSTLGVLASSQQRALGAESWQAAALIFNSDDNRTSNASDDVTVTLTGLQAQPGQCVCVCGSVCLVRWCHQLLPPACRSALRHLLPGQPGEQSVPAVAGDGPARFPQCGAVQAPAQPTSELRPLATPLKVGGNHAWVGVTGQNSEK